MNRRTAMLAFALPLGLTVGLATMAARADTMEMSTPPAGSAKVIAADAMMRGLWTDHIFWVRNVVVATLGKNKAAAKSAEAQVVANAHAIADSIEPFYGTAASDGLFKLLAGHYGAIKAYLTATVAGSKSGQDAATKDLMDNVDKIGDFLSGANPNLPKDAVVGLFQAHAGHHINQIEELKAKHYDEEAQNWADMREHMNVISDALIGAIAKQFPDKF